MELKAINQVISSDDSLETKTKKLLNLEKVTRHNLQEESNKEIISQVLQLNQDQPNLFTLAISLSSRNAAFIPSIKAILTFLFTTYEQTLSKTPNPEFLETIITITEGKLHFEDFYNKSLNYYFNLHYASYQKSNNLSDLEQALHYLELIRLDNFTNNNYTFQLETILNKFKVTILLSVYYISKSKPISSNIMHKLHLIFRKITMMSINKSLTTDAQILEINKYKLYYNILLLIHDFILNKTLFTSLNQKPDSKSKKTSMSLKLEYKKFIDSDFSGFTLKEQNSQNSEDSIIEISKTFLKFYKLTKNKDFLMLASVLCLSSNSDLDKNKFIKNLKYNHKNCLMEIYFDNSNNKSKENLMSLIDCFNNKELIYFENSNLKNVYKFSKNLKTFFTELGNVLIEDKEEEVLGLFIKAFEIAELRLKFVVSEYNLNIISKGISKIGIETICKICCLKEGEGRALIKELIKKGKLKGRVNDINDYLYFEKDEERVKNNKIKLLNETVGKIEEASRLIDKEYRKVKVK